MPNVRHAITYVVLSSVEKDKCPNHAKQLKDVQGFTLVNRRADFPMNEEHKKLTLKDALIELVNIVSSLNLGSAKVLDEEHVQLLGVDIVDA